MDIIFTVDYAQNRISSAFCALDEHTYRTPPSDETGGCASTFAIRFYAWTASLFAADKLNSSANAVFPVDAFFHSLERTLTPILFEETTLMGKILAAERALLAVLRPERADPAVLNAIHHLLRTEGRARISEVSDALALSNRQLERRFDAVMGLSPKALAGLMRYQLLWQDMALNPHFDALDAVARFGYTDQAHLLNDFRRRHGMSPKEAIGFARR
jgi:AraC-like DNA-binding protein